MTRKIFIVDDHPTMRRGYASLIDAEPDLSMAGEAGSAEEALVALAETAPDLVVADVSLAGRNGLELARQLLEWHPDLPILIASMHDELLYAERALQAGARGYIMKTEGDEALLWAIRRVLRGRIALSDTMQNRLLFRHVGPAPSMGRAAVEGSAPSSTLDKLSDRELEVFELIGQGRTAREIAELLAISPKTVESHRARIKHKLGVTSPNELVRRAFLWAHSIGKP